MPSLQQTKSSLKKMIKVCVRVMETARAASPLLENIKRYFKIFLELSESDDY